MFVKDEDIPVSLDSEDLPHEQRNIIYIKPKLDFGARSRVQDAIVSVKVTGNAQADTSMLVGTGNLALLTESISKWSGPAFENMPCNAANIAKLDPDEPLVDKVLAEINRRNPIGKTSADPKGSSANGSASLTESLNGPWDRGIFTSS